MNKAIITIVNAPEVTLEEHEKAGDLLLKFYRALGWNGEDVLDPCKVKTTTSVYKRLYDLAYEKYPNTVAIGMHMVNRGPGTDDFIKAGQVWLYQGWVEPAAHEEGEKTDGTELQAV